MDTQEVTEAVKDVKQGELIVVDWVDVNELEVRPDATVVPARCRSVGWFDLHDDSDPDYGYLVITREMRRDDVDKQAFPDGVITGIYASINTRREHF